MPVKPWFPTFIYESPLERKGSREYAQRLHAECLRVREQDSEGQSWCEQNYPKGYTSYGTLRMLHRTLPPFIDLENKIWPHIKRFARHIDMELQEANLSMLDCWVNIMSEGSTHGFHDHPGAVFSGTFYVATPENCSAIRFEDPRLEKFENTPPKRRVCRPANQRVVPYAAEAGKLILFESWLRHGVVPNPTVDERVSVSFNYAWV